MAGFASLKIVFGLAWAKGRMGPRSFKSAPAFELFSEYSKRISKFTSCDAAVFEPSSPKKPGSKLWICHRPAPAKYLSSEDVAARLEKLEREGIKELCVAVGPADGFLAAEVETMKPDLVWSFGPLTLPHELAAAVAAEQIYRALTILRGLPYHSDH